MNKFKERQEKNIKTLEQYVPVVAKVHGDNHPEFHEARKTIDDIINKIHSNDYRNLNLDDEFSRLRDITSNYEIPSDTCETYEAVFNIVSDLDKDYIKYFKE